MADILVDEPQPGVKRLTLNRPEAMNAFTFAMYRELIALLEDIRLDPKVRVVILTATGRGFCTGHDLRAGGEPEWIDPETTKPYRSRYAMAVLTEIPRLIRNLPQPVICGVNGTVAGMGFSLQLVCDISIAAESAKWVNSIHNAATGAELGMSYLLPRAVGAQKAAEILLTARTVRSDEAERCGLVLKTVPDDQMMDECLKLAADISVNVPLGIWTTKQSMHLNAHAGSLEQAMEIEGRAVFIAQSTEDAAEKRQSFFEKREPKFSNR
nr:enoyl-CoA hydratase-related protein [uncultured Brevundimonas sp.]